MMTVDKPRRRNAERITERTFLRFAIVGASSSIAYALIVAAVIRVSDVPPYIASVVLFGLFIPLTFLAHKHISFRATSVVRHASFAYAALQICCFGMVSAVSSNFVTGVYGLDVLLYLATVGIAALASFFIGTRFIFRPSREVARQNEGTGRKPH